MSKSTLIKILKWIAGIILSLVVIISVLVYAFKDEICGMVITEVNKNLNAKVNVSEVDLAFWGSFPNLSVDFNDVFIQDPRADKSNTDTLLFSKKIRLKFNPIDIYNEDYTLKSIEIKPGYLNIDVDTNGVSNYDIFISQNDSIDSSSFSMNLKKVKFNDFRFRYANAISNQQYLTKINKMTLTGAFNSSKFTTKADCDIDIVSAKSGAVTLISNQPAKLDIQVNIDKDSSLIEFPKSTIFISELPFSFEGLISPEKFHFNLNGNDISINDIAEKLAIKETKDIKNLKGTGQLIFDLNFDKEFETQQIMAVSCDFGIKNGTLNEPTTKIAVKNLNLKGSYNNGHGNLNEKLKIESFTFATKAGPFQGNLLISNFNNPIYKGKTVGNVDLNVIQQLFAIPNIEKLNGIVSIDARYNIQGMDNSAKYLINHFRGSAKIKNVNLKMAEDKRVFENINGTVLLRDDAIGVENISVKLNKSDLELTGVLTNLDNYLSHKGNLSADLSIASKRIRLEDLGTESKEVIIQSARAFILPNDIDGDLILDIAKLTYDKQTFKQIRGNLALRGRNLDFKQIQIENGSAQIVGKLSIEERTPEIFHISSQLVSNNIDFKPLFKEWANFNQDVLLAKNISGQAQVNLNFKAPFDLRSGILSNQIEAKISVQIDNGRLQNVKSFNSIIESAKTTSAKAIIGNENLDYFGEELKDLKFQQLKNTFYIKDGILTIPSMSINSSALDIEIAGNHTFDNRIDYRFGFRLKDLKKKEQSEFGEIIDDGSGVNIFMRMYGDLDNPQFEWDKAARKANSKENREAEKESVKSILKSEFGLFKNDSTVTEYIAAPDIIEEINVQFDPINEIDEIIEETKPKKPKKNRPLFNKWKKENEDDDDKESFELE